MKKSNWWADIFEVAVRGNFERACCAGTCYEEKDDEGLQKT